MDIEAETGICIGDQRVKCKAMEEEEELTTGSLMP